MYGAGDGAGDDEEVEADLDFGDDEDILTCDDADDECELALVAADS